MDENTTTGSSSSSSSSSRRTNHTHRHTHCSMRQRIQRFQQTTAAAVEDDQACLVEQRTKKHPCVVTNQTVCYLRRATLLALCLTSCVVGAGVYTYTRRRESNDLARAWEDSVTEIAASFHTVLERNLQVAGSLSQTITTVAAASHQTFPFVTIPDFELLGSYARILSGSHTVRYLPLVSDKDRDEWETYARDNLHHLAASKERDDLYRQQQEEQIALVKAMQQEEEADDDDETHGKRYLQGDGKGGGNGGGNGKGNGNGGGNGGGDKSGGGGKGNGAGSGSNLPTESNGGNRTYTVDEDGYHPKIWNGGPKKARYDEPEGNGPFLVEWQRSPSRETYQERVNLNWFQGRALGGEEVDRVLQTDRKALLSFARGPPGLHTSGRGRAEELAMSQYREHPEDYLSGYSSVVVYPVFASTEDEEDAPLVGAVVTSVYWKVLMSDLLSVQQRGILVVVENGYDQKFHFRIDGHEATFVGTGEPVMDSKYRAMGRVFGVNEYLQQRVSLTNTPYRSVSLSEKSAYRIRVYPTAETETPFLSNKPIIYTLVVLSCFLFASLLFFLFAWVVERRQEIMFQEVVQNAQKAAAAERELNEFMSHEVRNPLASAMSACTFITTAVNEANPLSDPETVLYVREDLEVVNTSLSFINDFLRSMLDIHRANMNQIKIHKTVVDVKQDILESVAAILYKRVALFDVEVECPDGLLIETDAIRLKQVILNLARNSAKFVQKGFIRLRATVDNNSVSLMVEDSGPGIPIEKQAQLFAKYQDSLDLLNQGTGLGLSLCQKLVQIMRGDIWLDLDYDSGVEGCPGARFVVDLYTPPEMDLDDSQHGALSSASVAVPSVSPSARPLAESKLTSPNMISSKTAILSPRRQDPAPFINECMAQFPTSAENQNWNDVEKQLPAVTNPVTLDEKSLPSQLRVLFVDDDSILRRLMVRAVRKIQPTWELMEAASGEAGLQMCDSNTFDLIFMDQYMASAEKQLLGTETVQSMRSKGVTAVICGLSANDISDSFLDAGANNFILKPFPCKRDDLLIKLQKLLTK